MNGCSSKRILGKKPQFLLYSKGTYPSYACRNKLGEAMAKQYCNAEQADTSKLIPTLAVLCLMSVAVLTPAATAELLLPASATTIKCYGCYDCAPSAIVGQAEYDGDREFLKAGGVFSDDLIDSFIELKMEEVTRFRMSTHPVEFDMYYSL